KFQVRWGQCVATLATQTHRYKSAPMAISALASNFSPHFATLRPPPPSIAIDHLQTRSMSTQSLSSSPPKEHVAEHWIRSLEHSRHFGVIAQPSSSHLGIPKMQNARSRNHTRT